MNAATLLESYQKSHKPLRPPRYFKRLRQWWAMIMLRRSLYRSGVHVWKYSDEELKAQCSEGLRQGAELMKADVERRELERIYRLN